MVSVDFDELSYPYIIIGRDRNVKLANKFFARFLGKKLGDVVDKRVGDLDLPDDLNVKFVSKLPILINIAEGMYDKKHPSKAVIPIKSLPFSVVINGNEFEGLVNCKAVLDEKGKVSELILWAIPSYLICVHSLEGKDSLAGFYDESGDIFYLGQDYGMKYLTSKEFQVFSQVLLYGDSDEAIAERLGVSRSTCRVHLRSICSKTDCKSRGELVSKAMGCGWYSMVKSLDKAKDK